MVPPAEPDTPMPTPPGKPDTPFPDRGEPDIAPAPPPDSLATPTDPKG